MANFCTNCGTKIRKEDNFCTNCGTKIRKDDNFCTNCRTKIRKDDNFCTNCGTKIDKLDMQNNYSLKSSSANIEKVIREKEQIRILKQKEIRSEK
ncbi:zinc ribbon domain-containing protein [uncultured Methanobrevibacter sp.]|uniref:zinc ribbon domain-containing protein n=1 Tax=uncultured Methanobrevibacter sp. TaxID=253161 RepID=UPI0025EC1864|nr:zinc-ribbon domain-containing protein [uncultured Methanobrevibacter sp.]